MKIHTIKLGFVLLSLSLSTALLLSSFGTAGASKTADFKVGQTLKQHSVCAENSACSNLGFNAAEMIKGLKQKIYAKVHQELRQHNLCVESECINEGGNEITVNGKDNANVNSQQRIVQTNQCAAGATCINSAGNVYLIGNPTTVNN